MYYLILVLYLGLQVMLILNQYVFISCCIYSSVLSTFYNVLCDTKIREVYLEDAEYDCT
jgi:hypothetical protein